MTTQLKIAVLGADKVGKTQFINGLFLNKPFSETYQYESEPQSFQVTVSKELSLEVVEATNTSKYNPQNQKAVKDSHLFVFCFDPHSRASLDAVTALMEKYKTHLNQSIRPKLILVATKCNNPGKIEVSLKEASQFADNHKMSHWSISAEDESATNENFDEENPDENNKENLFGEMIEQAQDIEIKRVETQAKVDEIAKFERLKSAYDAKRSGLSKTRVGRFFSKQLGKHSTVVDAARDLSELKAALKSGKGASVKALANG